MEDLIGTATYSPEDNKIRISAFHRLDPELYARVKAAGFSWAPRQEIFVASMWTPSREDLAIELCGEIDDEDTSLIDRAEARAERFEDYKESRIKDAEQAQAGVHRIADGIPFGQPILVGHHSERHARKDAERIQNGMARTVKMWETADYWQRRAAGAIAHAKYKELPAVRARRIKTLGADMRKVERSRDEVAAQLATWQKLAAIEDPEKQKEMAVLVAGRSRVWVRMPRKEGDKPDFDQSPDVYTCLTGSYPTLYAPRTVAEVLEHVLAALTHSTRPGNSTERWITHYTNRIAYERAMLDESGGLVAEQQEIKVGGRVLVGGEWVVVLRVNRKDGKVCSFRTARRYVPVVGAEEVCGYEPPSEEQAATVAEAMKKGPLCNYPGERFATCTQAEWDAIYKDHRGSEVIAATETTGTHRVRKAIGFKLHLPAPTGKELEPGYCNANRTHHYWPVFITDAKRVDPPSIPLIPPPAVDLPAREIADLAEPSQSLYASVNRADSRIPSYSEREDMTKMAKTPIQVVAVPQLFPTPPDLARRMVDLADIEPGLRILEPSAGTGAIVDAIRAAIQAAGGQCDIEAVEINPILAHRLAFHDALGGNRVHPGDFLEQNGNLGKFDRVLMNPPFSNGDDIKHIKHAVSFLKPGGRLVAICVDGPRQNEKLRPLADTWEALPAGTFKDSGTNVNTVLLTIEG